jgi:hypothetical protein
MTDAEYKFYGYIISAVITGFFAIAGYFLKKYFDSIRDEAERKHAILLLELQIKANAAEAEKGRLASEAAAEKESRNAQMEEIRRRNIAARDIAFRGLKAAVLELFDSFDVLLAKAGALEDHELGRPLHLSLTAMAGLDAAIASAKPLTLDKKESVRLNRLKLMQKFFHRILLTLTRKKSERVAILPTLNMLRTQLAKRRDIALAHVNIVIEAHS